MLHLCGSSASVLLPRTAAASAVRIPVLRSITLLRPSPPLLPQRAPLLRLFHQSFRFNTRKQSSRPESPAKTKPPSIIASKSSNATPATQSTGPRLYERLYKAGSLSDLDAPPKMSNFERLFRPFVFTVLVSGGALYYGYTWRPPKPEERWFPTVPIAFATVASIIAINTVVFLTWRIPVPATWRLLNRYFISVTAVPYSASLLGNVFSHQSPTHLMMNMFVLYVFGTSLCEQIGSGWFLALYLSGGVVSSFGSMAHNVIRARYTVTSLGASGAISALVATYAYFNPDRELYLVFLPFIAFKAKTLVSCMAAFEVVGIVRGWQVLDHVAHLSGLAWGLAFAKWLEGEVKRRRAGHRRRLEERGLR